MISDSNNAVIASDKIDAYWLEQFQSKVSDDELRAAGFTSDARNYPRCLKGLRALCAWNNVKCDLNVIPLGWLFYPNKHTKEAWERVIGVLT